MIVRADASSAIGAGHIMRCAALAQAWQDSGGKAVFLSGCESGNLQKRILEEGFDFIDMEKSHPHHSDLETTLDVLKYTGADWLVLDGYRFDGTYQKSIRNEGHKLLVIDDMNHLPSYHADILLNQNLHAPSLDYLCDRDTTTLLGPRHVMLRREFLQFRDRKRDIPGKAARVLVTMGGADPENATLRAVRALNSLNDRELEARVVAGPANPNIESIKSELALSNFSVELLSNAKNMPELMHWADLAVSAGGGACWELCFSGTPFLVLVLAENQRSVGEALNETGAAECLGRHDEVSEKSLEKFLRKVIGDRNKRKRMAERGKKLIDGKGAERVVRHMRVGRMRLRRADQSDCELLWKWANDPLTRSMSFNSNYIDWDEHKTWFATKLSDAKCLFYMALTESGEPFGQIRFDIDGDFGVVSINLSPEFRSFGIGAKVTKSACDTFIRDSGTKKIRALIKDANPASLRCFEKAGFESAGDPETNLSAVRMEYFRD